MRKQAHIEYYEVIWSKMKKNFWYDEDMSELTEYSTLEKPDVFEIYYQQIVNEFKQKLSEKKSKKSNF